jgi:HAD superfamily hydrolase (TIGR01549 family)
VAAPPLILFDLDDTLCDYSGARVGRLRGAFGDAFAAAGIDAIDLDAVVAESIAIHPHGSDHFADLLARHGVADEELAQAARRWYHQNRFLGLDLYPDARSVLDAVRLLPGVRGIGVITNGPADVQRAKLDLLDLWRAIDFAVISGELGIEKPDPRIFAEALRLGGRDAAEAVYIGDSPEFDIEGARSAAIPVVWMNRPAAPWPHDSPAPQHEIRELTELLDLLPTLCQ